MKKEIDESIKQEEYSKMVNSNSLLLTFEGWIKYIEGFTKGLEATEKVASVAVLDCIGEILEYLTSFKVQLLNLLMHCESILEENEKLKVELEKLKTPLLIQKEVNDEDL